MHGIRRAGAVLGVLGLLGALCVAVQTIATSSAAAPGLGTGTVLELQVGGVGDVPMNAAAAALNFTVTNPAAVGYVTVYPCGVTRPVASNLNYVAGQTIPNLVLAKLGTGGRVCVYTFVATDLIADVSGYFPAGSGYTPIDNPTRILDTRQSLPVSRLGAGAVLELQVGGVGGVPPNAAAAALNFTVTNPAAVGYVTVYPCGVTRPLASNLNYVAGQAIPNLVLAKLGTGGRVCVYSFVATDVIADVSGYFPAGSGYTPIDNPTRILDTRTSPATCGLAGAVFCETFSAPKGQGTRTGDLDPVLWGVSRVGEINPGQGVANDIPQVSMAGCGTTAWTFTPGDVRICNGQMYETVNDGGGVTNLDTYPKQPFDFAGRTGRVVFDVSADSDGTHGAWPEFIITDKPVPGMRKSTTGDTPPAAFNQIGFSLDGCTAGPGGTTGVGLVFMSKNGVYSEPGFQSTGCVTKGSAQAMNHFEVQLSQNRLEVWGTDAGSTTLRRLAVADNLGLAFTKGLVWLDDVHYNARKAIEPCECGTQFNHTFVWDNLAFDGPKTYRDLGFDVPDANVPGKPTSAGDPTRRTGYKVGTGDVTLPVNGVRRDQTPTGALVVLNTYSFAATIPSIRINGGPWIDTAWPSWGTTFSWMSMAIPVPLDQIHDGNNTLTFKSGDDSTTIANISIILVAAAPVP